MTYKNPTTPENPYKNVTGTLQKHHKDLAKTHQSRGLSTCYVADREGKQAPPYKSVTQTPPRSCKDPTKTLQEPPVSCAPAPKAQLTPFVLPLCPGGRVASKHKLPAYRSLTSTLFPDIIFPYVSHVHSSRDLPLHSSTALVEVFTLSRAVQTLPFFGSTVHTESDIVANVCGLRRAPHCRRTACAVELLCLSFSV